MVPLYLRRMQMQVRGSSLLSPLIVAGSGVAWGAGTGPLARGTVHGSALQRTSDDRADGRHKRFILLYIGIRYIRLLYITPAPLCKRECRSAPNGAALRFQVAAANARSARSAFSAALTVVPVRRKLPSL